MAEWEWFDLLRGITAVDERPKYLRGRDGAVYRISAEVARELYPPIQSVAMQGIWLGSAAEAEVRQQTFELIQDAIRRATADRRRHQDRLWFLTARETGAPPTSVSIPALEELTDVADLQSFVNREMRTGHEKAFDELIGWPFWVDEAAPVHAVPAEIEARLRRPDPEQFRRERLGNWPVSDGDGGTAQ